MTMRTCGACRFFVVENAAARMGSLALYSETTGECRRYPPVMARGADRRTAGYAPLPAAEWPILPASAWCGEHAIPAEQAPV